MIGLGTKVFGLLSVGLLCSSLWFYSQYQSQIAENEILLSNIDKLELTILTQNDTIDSLQRGQESLSESVLILTNNNNALNNEMSEALTEVNTLRGTLLQRSIENPFAVSNMNTQRWQDRKKAMVGGKDE